MFHNQSLLAQKLGRSYPIPDKEVLRVLSNECRRWEAYIIMLWIRCFGYEYVTNDGRVFTYVNKK